MERRGEVRLRRGEVKGRRGEEIEKERVGEKRLGNGVQRKGKIRDGEKRKK